MGLIATKAELSNILGRDERTLTRWQDDGMPVEEYGLGRGNENRYDTEQVIQWLLQRAALNGKKESARDRLDRVKADREELALAKDLGEVVLATELVERYEAMVTAAKIELLNTLPDQLAGELSARYGVEVDDQLIREPIEAILRRLAEYDPEDGTPSDGDLEQPDYPPFAEEDDE
ncbi:TPA: terminase small subunit [Pseudomonas aeruginosa]|nr:terminase small subunit [Pseudomonas aeruginosa]HEJ5828895.1 terminase small subunit [Pseudomonas aeruginosa]HEJ5937858.1 terminase small subunit [Pseudomonas aeruginosa]HEK0119079.1 terminase small subunit [Pseudomonas aeruginosa]